jgi:hypothetical protein
MPPLPRGTCPDCHEEIPLRVNGTLREHRDWLSGELCPASGTAPGGRP